MNSHEVLAQHLIDSGVLKTPAIIDAFRAIDRRNFVTQEMRDSAYIDAALPTLAGQTISQPYTVAYMLEMLQPQTGDNLLDIGSGSGWQTALLAHIVGETGHVTAVEIVPAVYEMGKENVDKYSFIKKGIVEMHCRGGRRGYSDNAPYDGIIAAADAGNDVPKEWLRQVKRGGRIVVPTGNSLMLLVKKLEDEWEYSKHKGFVFVPLVDD